MRGISRERSVKRLAISCCVFVSFAIQAEFVFSGDELSEAEAKIFYHLAEGSEIVPTEWLLALKGKATGKPFLEDLSRFGLLSDKKNEGNNFGLPVGITANRTINVMTGENLGLMTGVNCAACHVGEITYRGTTKRVNGMPGRFDITKFYREMAESFLYTIKSPIRFAEFLFQLKNVTQDEGTKKSLQYGRLLSDHATAQNSYSVMQEDSSGDSGNLELAKGLESISKNLSTQVRSFPVDKREKILEAALLTSLQTVESRPKVSVTDVLLWTDLKSVHDEFINESYQELPDLLRTNLTMENTLKNIDSPGPKKVTAGTGLAESIAKDFESQDFSSPLRFAETKEEAVKIAARTEEDFAQALNTTWHRVKFLVGFLLNLQGRQSNSGGYGRVDAFGSARKSIFGVDSYKNIKNDAPVSYPAIWGVGQISWYHWDGNTTALLLRNAGQAVGVGASWNSDTKDSTLQLDNIVKLEELATKFEAPTWPSDVFPAINLTKADKGKHLFKKHCLECHEVPSGNSKFRDKNIPLIELGTDPGRALNFAAKLGRKEFAGELAQVVAQLVEKKLGVKVDKDKLGEWRTTGKYAARPLKGVWATPPYLHNGSVPSLWHLLQPAQCLKVSKKSTKVDNCRPKSFKVGTTEYDPVHVGFEDKGDYTVDTQVPGNFNTGHEFGTKLADEEKWALLEYMKTL